MRSLLSAIPADVEQLTQYIRYLTRTRPPLPFSKIINYHNRHPQCHSVESHNILLGMSIKHGRLKTSESLLNSLSMNHIEPNEATEKLVVRLLVSCGLWDKAWQQVLDRYSTIQAIPLPIFLELLAPNPKHFRYPSLKNLQQTQSDQNAPYPICHVPQGFSRLVLYRFADLSSAALKKVSFRVLNYMVRSFVKDGHDAMAIHLTEVYIKSLPKKISTRRIEHAQILINTHLSTGEIKLATYERRKRLVERLFALHPQLYPDSNTLFLLMRYMARSKRCGIEAYLLYKSYIARWGQRMNDLRVRGRIIKYALKQRKLGIARELSTYPDATFNSPPPKDFTDSLELLPWRSAYPGRGRDRSDFKAIVFKRLHEGRRTQWQVKRLRASRRISVQELRRKK